MPFSNLSFFLRKHLNYDWLEGNGMRKRYYFKPNFWDGRLKTSPGLITNTFKGIYEFGEKIISMLLIVDNSNLFKFCNATML